MNIQKISQFTPFTGKVLIRPNGISYDDPMGMSCAQPRYNDGSMGYAGQCRVFVESRGLIEDTFDGSGAEN